MSPLALPTIALVFSEVRAPLLMRCVSELFTPMDPWHGNEPSELEIMSVHVQKATSFRTATNFVVELPTALLRIDCE